MNKEEEFNNNQLEEILKELKDVENYKGFKDGAWKYELGYYQGLLIVDKINQLKERVEYLERSNNRREETIIEERKEISDLENKIDKAIEFMENEESFPDYKYYDGELVSGSDLSQLLKILKGEQNEKII